MDVLTDILDGLEMQGSIYFVAEYSAPWSIDVPPDTNVCRFHVVVHGSCHITVPETGDIRNLSKGDLVLVPHGNGHWLQSSPDLPLAQLPKILDEDSVDEDGCLRWGGGGAASRMVCGFFAFDKESAHPLLAALPGLVHVQATSSYDFGWIENIMRFIGQETGSGRPGSEAISRRLSEILFIQVIRHYAEHASVAVPILSAIVDPYLGRALRAIHSNPGKEWSVGTLARESALSRTAFAERFRGLVGRPPMQYLTEQRMRTAKRLLRGEDSVAAVGETVGYRSEAAFHRAFKKVVGVGPGAFRRSRRQSAS